MDGLWQAVDFNQLLDAGLFKVFPALKFKPHLLHQRAIQLRRGYFEYETHDLPPRIIEMHRKLARCFGEAWEGTILVALLASRKRDLSIESISGLLVELGPIQLPSLALPSNSACSAVHHAWLGVPEATHFMQVLRLLNDLQAQSGKTGDGDYDSAIDV